MNSVQTRRNCEVPADVLLAAFQIPQVRHRKKSLNPRNSRPLLFPVSYLSDVTKIPDFFCEIEDIGGELMPEMVIKKIFDTPTYNSKYKLLCRLCGLSDKDPIFSNKNCKKKAKNWKADKSEVISFLLGNNEKDKVNICIDTNFVPFKFKSWKTAGFSYKKIPEPFPYSEIVTVCDFIENRYYRSVMSGKEGAYYGKTTEIPVPSIVDAQLSLNLMLDCISELDVLYEKELKSPSASNSTQSLAITKFDILNRLNMATESRDFMCFSIPSFRGAIHSIYPKIHTKDIKIVFSALISCECGLSFISNQNNYITKLVHNFSQILYQSLLTPGKPIHITCNSSHCAFVYNLFHFYNIISKYLSFDSWLPTQAFFESLDKEHNDLIMISPIDVNKLSNNIEKGASLSNAFRTLYASAFQSLSFMKQNSSFNKMNESRGFSDYSISLPVYDMSIIYKDSTIEIMVQSYHNTAIYESEISPNYWNLYYFDHSYTTIKRIITFKEKDSIIFIPSYKERIGNVLKFVPGLSSYFFAEQI